MEGKEVEYNLLEPADQYRDHFEGKLILIHEFGFFLTSPPFSIFLSCHLFRKKRYDNHPIHWCMSYFEFILVVPNLFNICDDRLLQNGAALHYHPQQVLLNTYFVDGSAVFQIHIIFIWIPIRIVIIIRIWFRVQ